MPPSSPWVETRCLQTSHDSALPVTWPCAKWSVPTACNVQGYPNLSKPHRYCKLYLYKLLEKLCDVVASLMQSICIIFQPFNCRFWNHPAFPRSHDIWRTWRASLAHWRHARHRTSVHPSRDRHPRHRLGLPCLQIPIRPKASLAQGLQLPWRKVVFKI